MTFKIEKEIILAVEIVTFIAQNVTRAIIVDMMEEGSNPSDITSHRQTFITTPTETTIITIETLSRGMIFVEGEEEVVEAEEVVDSIMILANSNRLPSLLETFIQW